jgi:hypothetical protein
MQVQRLSVVLTVMNIALLIVLWSKLYPVHAQKEVQNVDRVLRGRALEIVDDLGKVRASITIQQPVTVDGKMYPQTVLLRLIDSKGKPMVKLGAAENGSGLTLINSYDEGVVMNGKNDTCFVKITHHKRERVIEP